MTLSEFKMTLTLDSSVATTSDANDATIVLQKRISLNPFKRHTMLSLDFLDDSVLELSSDQAKTGFQFYVSKFPIITTSDKSAFGSEMGRYNGPAAGDWNVLFKAQGLLLDTYRVDEQFPNSFLGATETFQWYTPHVYLTLFLQGQQGVPTDYFPEMSIYMAIDETDVDEVEFGMGYIREYADAQRAVFPSTLVRVASDPTERAGEVFPMWLMGGIRPERMMRSDALANFFMDLAPTHPEPMMSRLDAVIFADQSRTMQPFDEAFGAEDVAKGGIPDWLNFSGIEGIGYGEVMSQFPPVVHDDNGNVRMV